MVPAVTAKVAVLDRVGTTTDPGTVRRELLSVRAIVRPADWAVFRFSVIVQELDSPEASEEGVQPKEDIVSSDARMKFACSEEPFNVAVSTAR
jgi:hypothetical protein